MVVLVVIGVDVVVLVSMILVVDAITVVVVGSRQTPELHVPLYELVSQCDPSPIWGPIKQLPLIHIPRL